MCSAAAHGDKQTVAQLLALGVSADSDDPQRVTPLICSLGSSRATEIAQLLFNHGANVNAVVQGEMSAISHALMMGSGEVIDFLFKHGADLAILTPENKQDILGSAAAWGQEDMVRFALDLGADPHVAYNPSGTTPIGVARKYASEENSEPHRRIVKILEEWVAKRKDSGADSHA